MPLSVNTPSDNIVTRRAIKRVVKQSTGKEPLSSLTVGCLTGDLYDFYKSATLLMTIKKASQQTFENDLKRLAELLKCMKPPMTLIFQSGGTLELPGWFRGLCAALGMTIIMLESEHQIPEVIRLLGPVASSGTARGE
ncbi:MAG: hypothetical protein WCI64_11560 [Chlorobium sp.]